MSHKILKIEMNTCPRCEEKHPGIIFTPFKKENHLHKNRIENHTHHAMCPVNLEPICSNFTGYSYND